MKVRLIKPGISAAPEKQEDSPAKVPIIDTIQSWVREFRSRKTDKSLLDFKRIRNLGKR
ncbi:MAG TPA: hypothetical protein VN937_23205 [Blastocatellia bacterium]|nr:hypothetical protein [Blastocatellia bacterium]